MVTGVDGLAVAGNLTFSLNIPFGSASVAQVNQTISASGKQIFSFVVPANTTLTSTRGSFVVSNGSVSQSYGFPLSIIQGNTQVVDFFPESGVLIYNVSNKIYFQSWTDSSRTVPADFSGATLVETRVNGSGVVTSPVANLSISTVDQGRGYFYYTPREYVQSVLTVVGKYATTATFTLTSLTSFSNVTSALSGFPSNREVAFSVLNTNKILGQGESLQLVFRSNNLVDASKGIYFVQVKSKERILVARQVNISANSTVYLNLSGSSIVVPNGGVIIVSLYKATDNFVYDYKSLGVANITANSSIPAANATQVNSWLQAAGETLVFVQPSKTLAV